MINRNCRFHISELPITIEKCILMTTIMKFRYEYYLLIIIYVRKIGPQSQSQLQIGICKIFFKLNFRSKKLKRL